MSAQAMTAQRISVRDATDEDVDRVVSVLEAANAEFEKIVPKPFYRAYLANVLDVSSRRAESQLLLAELGDPGRVVGSITLYPDAASEGWGWPAGWAGVRAVAVEPSARGLGIGRRLAETCIERSRAFKAPAVCLHTAWFMEDAIRMYESVGFRRVPDYDGDAAEMVGAGPLEPAIVALAYRLKLTGGDE
jgi:ribosomal protein S18 acetylase RimI-like enzyme